MGLLVVQCVVSFNNQQPFEEITDAKTLLGNTMVLKSLHAV
jgi:hypothetical protein